MEENFNQNDLKLIKKQGIEFATILSQFEILKNGVPKVKLHRPATIHDGILLLSEIEIEKYAAYFDAVKNDLKLLKFVPASGAASRMFKFLIEFLHEFDSVKETINGYINRKNEAELKVFLVGKQKFPFHKDLKNLLKLVYSDFQSLPSDQKDFEYIKFLISKDYFDFANKPKAILPFHAYANHTATALEEHLWECAAYATANKKSNLHFTISEEHLQEFDIIIEKVQPKIESEFDIKLCVSYSFQHKNTDAISLNDKKVPFRDKNQNLVFRPGGHGALIKNLDDLDADIIFIKNIDNVIQNHIKIISLHKKCLAGILIQLQNKIFEYLKLINDNNFTTEKIAELVDFLSTKLNIEISKSFEKFTFENKKEYLFEKLNRPVRICGMVKNEGEPGGGPFWILNDDGNNSLQIIESNQIDLSNHSQKDILDAATHFNPVDIVCGTKNYLGEKFNLQHFVNPNTGFIVEKNKDGKNIKSYELPGLWNGAMAHWITIFVEVPLITFNPVKTVNDLLKPAHQQQN